MRIANRVVAAALSLAITAPSVRAVSIRNDRTEAQYINLAASYPSVGKFSTSTTGTATAVLIQPQYILTAAHKITAGDTYSFNVGGNDYAVDSVVVNPGWNGDFANGNDIAVLHLTSPVTNVTPAPLYTPSLGPEKGQTGTLVGFGSFGTGNDGATNDSYIGRAGTNNIDAYGGDQSFNASNQRVINSSTMQDLLAPFSPNIMFFDFDKPGDTSKSLMGGSAGAVPLDLEGMLANGDSGGGTFIRVGGIDYLAGIHSGIFETSGDSKPSSYGDLGSDTRVSQYISFINQNTPEPSGAMLIAGAGALLLRRKRRVG